jgi:hypothetical protein
MVYLGHVKNLSLLFIMPVNLAYRDEWMDLTCGIPWVLALGPKLWFQPYFVNCQLGTDFVSKNYNLAMLRIFLVPESTWFDLTKDLAEPPIPFVCAGHRQCLSSESLWVYRSVPWNPTQCCPAPHCLAPWVCLACDCSCPLLPNTLCSRLETSSAL